MKLRKKIYRTRTKNILRNFREVKNIGENLSNLSEQISFIDVITSFPEFAEKEIIVDQNIKEFCYQISKRTAPSCGREFDWKWKICSNNCQMDHENNIWLMTGPNMTGKSTFLRQVAIIILLNQIGSYVPADDIEVGILTKFLLVLVPLTIFQRAVHIYDGNG